MRLLLRDRAQVHRRPCRNRRDLPTMQGGWVGWWLLNRDMQQVRAERNRPCPMGRTVTMAAKKSKSVERREAAQRSKPAPVYIKQVCSRCDGSGDDPEVRGCSCDVCAGTGEEEVLV
jgi:hypothetical protein